MIKRNEFDRLWHTKVEVVGAKQKLYQLFYWPEAWTNVLVRENYWFFSYIPNLDAYICSKPTLYCESEIKWERERERERDTDRKCKVKNVSVKERNRKKREIEREREKEGERKKGEREREEEREKKLLNVSRKSSQWSVRRSVTNNF